MINEGQVSPEIRIQGLIDKYLRSPSVSQESKDNGNHLDEDTLTAFIEGNLSPRTSAPTIKHLVDCSFCRHVTAELVRLDIAFGEETTAVPASLKQSEPTSISDVLNNLLSRIFGTSDSAVLAHQESEEEKKDDTKENQ